MTHVVVGKSVDAFPPALLLGGQVQVRQGLPCGAGAPLCVEGSKKDVNQSWNDLCHHRNNAPSQTINPHFVFHKSDSLDLSSSNF